MRRYHLGPTVGERPFPGAEFTVRIADDLRKATVFLGEEIAGDKGHSAIDPRATGFFVIWQSDSTRPIEGMEPECSGIYLITARHVAVPLGANFAIRFNKKGGGSEIEPIIGARWIPHPDETVDVAVLHCGYPDWADCVPIPGRLLAKPTPTDDIFSTVKDNEDLIFNNPNLGIGDIAYVVGLFHLLSGKNVNLPVVHTGHIALLPEDEKIQVKNPGERRSREVEAYLVEAHGLEGLSGAPVFARTSEPINAQRSHEGPPLQGGHKMEYPIAGRLHSWTVLLGLWQASWDERPSRILSKERKLSKDQKVPLGMGVVVPAYKIAETLNQPELMMARRQRYQDELNEGAATTDSLPSSESSPLATDANPNHLKDFTRLVDVAARKRPQGDQT